MTGESKSETVVKEIRRKTARRYSAECPIVFEDIQCYGHAHRVSKESFDK
ncbi:MAG: hypothetical protein U9O97_06750 [Elusimicrobiota bacterium]|nr:hypothetical protein [Elusimicrobiota bacterium]